MTNYYGFETTDEVQADAMGLPIGTYKAAAISEEPFEKDNKTIGVIVEWEALEGENKGRSGKVWYCTLHDNKQTANIAQQALKRLAEATGTPITKATPIKGRVATLQVDVQKKNPEYTEIKKYLPADHVVSPF